MLAGRVLLASLFIVEGSGKLLNLGAAAGYMAVNGLFVVLLPLAILVEIGGGLAILLGGQTRFAAFLLAGFCLLTALFFHTHFADRNQQIHFEKDVALAGAFLILWARGAGSWSYDRRPRT